jgi:hypothetical protein
MKGGYILAVPMALLCAFVMGGVWFFGTTAMDSGEFLMGFPVLTVLCLIFVGIPTHEMLHELPRRRAVRLLLPFFAMTMVPTWVALVLYESRSPLVMNHFDHYTPKLAVFAVLNGMYSSVDLVKAYRVRVWRR